MRKYKDLAICIIYATIIILVSQLTTYGVNYDSTIQYVSNETKEELLTNLNTVDNENLAKYIENDGNNENNLQKNSMDEASISQKEYYMVKESMIVHPIVTIWTNKETKVYSDMDEDSKVIETLYQGYNLQIEQIDDKWCRILSTQNYITTDNISYEEVAKNLNITKWVTSNLNLREDMNKKSNSLKILKPGSTVIVNDILGDWSKVTVGNKIGYVASKYLSETEYIPPKKVSLGTFKITHYCNCSICCGQWAGMGLTSSGAKLQAGTTIAVDPNVIPYGTKVEINGHTYIAQDCGGGVKRNHIDIYVPTHGEALSKGTYTVEVFKVNE